MKLQDDVLAKMRHATKKWSEIRNAVGATTFQISDDYKKLKQQLHILGVVLQLHTFWKGSQPSLPLGSHADQVATLHVNKGKQKTLH